MYFIDYKADKPTLELLAVLGKLKLCLEFIGLNTTSQVNNVNIIVAISPQHSECKDIFL